MAGSSSSDAHAGVRHLFVFSHGLHGRTEDLASLVDTLDDMLSTHCRQATGGKYSVLNSAINETKTRHGLLDCAKRLAREVGERLEQAADLGHQLRVSMIGYSMGGLVIRLAVGLLVEQGLLPQEHVQLVGFWSICTPHLGVRRPALGHWWNLPASAAASTVLGKSGRELMLRDNRKHPEKLPLLQALCEPDSTYMEGLRLFQKRTLVANTHFDVQVPFSSASLRWCNPYPTPRRHFTKTHVKVVGFDGFIDHQEEQTIMERISDGFINMYAEDAAMENYPSPETLSTNKEQKDQNGELLITPSMLHNLTAEGLEWRRVDCEVNSLLAHHILIGRRKLLERLVSKPGQELPVLRALVKIMLLDHDIPVPVGHEGDPFQD